MLQREKEPFCRKRLLLSIDNQSMRACFFEEDATMLLLFGNSQNFAPESLSDLNRSKQRSSITEPDFAAYRMPGGLLTGHLPLQPMP
jgi:hypothetical protein